MDFRDVPIGFGMELAMNQPALNAFSAMSEIERQEILAIARGASSLPEMRNIVTSLAPNAGL